MSSRQISLDMTNYCLPSDVQLVFVGTELSFIVINIGIFFTARDSGKFSKLVLSILKLISSTIPAIEFFVRKSKQQVRMLPCLELHQV
jgi:hypothetical protein